MSKPVDDDLRVCMRQLYEFIILTSGNTCLL